MALTGPAAGPLLPARPGPRRPAADRPLLRDATDAGVVVGALVLLLYALPPRLVVSGLGAAGRPALMLGFGLFAWWCAMRLVPGLAARGRQPVRWALAAYLLLYVLSYAAGYDRGLDGVEGRSADRGLLVTVALVGTALVVADGVPTRRSLDRLLRTLVLAGAGMSVVGALQHVAGIDLTRHIVVPGLSRNGTLIGIGARGSGDLSRVAGTAGHYIEFGVILGMLLPLALHYALFARSGRERRWRWLLVVVIGVGVPFSISRSAVLALVVGLVVVMAPWRLRAQANVAIGALVALVAVRATQPGLLGTIRSLFTNAGNDPSIQNRTSDYAAVSGYISERPWLGRGQGTFLPDRYVLLDNQLLGTLVSGGVLGLAALLVLFAVAFSLARRARRTAPDEQARSLGQALAAAVAVGLVASATFDSLGFTTFAMTLFLLFGATGALWRLTRGPAAAGRADEPVPDVPVLRERPLLRPLAGQAAR
ncbi:O-antigen ligase family protein [Motilibacter deserti]|uniref:O-antigen ligase-related domain-containing protein n=1 Tax=Motilibacter deserti TaxID=2714956 RepID=A0ABX0GYZ5_9ACTN|nr:O-antigen ligase family protein [Motilibacter deserti]NHC14418.1 hypothetical protein [Motilibacter deserti]